ncbi:MAG: hypothetical protein AAGA31_08555 [Bacteroidota bacterium]
MIVLKPAKSYQLIEECLALYNDGKPLKDRIRKQHYEAMQALVRLLQKEITNYQLFGLRAGTKARIRRLKTNRKQLAKWLKCCEKTAYNYLQRLEVAGWIKKTFHGSNASFGIDINTDLLFLQETTAKHSKNVVGIFENPLPHIRQTLPHTLSGVTSQDTKEYKELSGLTPDAASPADGVTQQQRDAFQDTKAGCHPSSENAGTPPSATPAPAKKVARKKVPPRKAPTTVAQAVADLPPHLVGRLRPLMDAVWNHAMEELEEWLPGYLIPAEVERGRAALAEFFVYSNPKCWKAAATEFLKRIDLAAGWCSRRQAAGKKAFIPLPSRYFNHRNQSGFIATKAWYKTYRHQLLVAARDKEVSRALNLYWRSLQGETAISKEEAVRQIKQRLEKRGGPDLYAQFTSKVFTYDDVLASA